MVLPQGGKQELERVGNGGEGVAREAERYRCVLLPQELSLLMQPGK